MVDRTLSSGTTVAASLGVRPAPRPDLANLGLADIELEKQAALERIVGFASTAPRLTPMPREGVSPGPGIYYSPGADRYFAGGVEFGSGDYDVALQAAQNLGAPTPPPAGGDWRRIPESTFRSYLNTIAEGRGFLGNLGVGFQQTGEGLVGGIGRGLQLLGAEETGGAIARFAEENIGLSPAERARSAEIARNQSLLGQIGTAAVQSLPTLAAALIPGLGAAGLAVRAGAAAGGVVARASALAGISTTVLPMELQSSWQAAEQGGYDTSDPKIRDEVLNAALLKTAGQILGPAFIAGGLSPALRRAVSESAQRTMGARIARGVGAGALEGSAEAFATLVDRVAFDPELRAEFNRADWAALGPLIVKKYGAEALVSFGAGFLLGAPLGAIGSPTQQVGQPTPRPPPAPSVPPVQRAGLDTTGAMDLLTGASLEPTAAQLEAEALERAWRNLPDQFGGAPFRREFSPEELALAGAWEERFAPATPPYPPGLPAPARTAGLLAPPPPPVTPAGYTGQQTEMFTPEAMGLPAVTQARLAGAQLPFTGAAPEVAAEPLSPVELEAAGQRRMELTTQPTAMGEQLNRLLQQQRARQEAESAARAAAEAQAAQKAEQERAQRARLENQLLRSRQEQAQRQADTEVLGETFVGNQFGILGADARAEWDAAVAALDPEVRAEITEGPARTRAGRVAEDTLADLAEVLRRRTSNKLRRQAAEPPTVIAPEVAPSALPEGVFGTADGKPFKNKAAAQLQRKRVASRENIQVDRLEPVEVPGGWGLRAREETPPTPPKGGRPNKGAPRAVQEPSPAPRTLRQRPEAGPRVRGKDTQGQEAAGARAKKVQEKVAPKREAAPPPTLAERVEGLTDEQLMRVQKLLAAVGEPDIDTAIDTNPDVVEAALGRVLKKPPAKRSEADLAAERAREVAARAEAAERTRLEAAARREAEAAAAREAAARAEAMAERSEAAQAWAAMQELNPDIEVDYNALPNDEKTKWAKAVRAGKGTLETARRMAERVLGPTAEREAVTEADILITTVQELELDMVQRGFDADKQDAAVELMRLFTDPTTPEQIKTDIQGILEGNLTPSQYLAVQQEAAALTAQISGKNKNQLGASIDTQIITQTISDINSGKLRNVTPSMRAALISAWKRVKGTNPEFSKGVPLANYIDEQSPSFFNFGARNAEGIRPAVNRDTGRPMLASFNEITTPMPKGRVEMLARTFIGRMAVRPKLHVFKNVAELQQRNPTLFAAADAARPQGDFATMRASGYSFGDGNVIVFSDNIVDEQHLKVVLAHESMGHFGMRAIIGDTRFNSLMNALYDTSGSIRSAADAAMASRKLSKSEAVEEYLADFAAVLDTSLIARIWAALKNGLNKLGVKFSDDAARYLVTQARRYVLSGKQGTFFINSEIAQRLHSIETGNDPDGTGRFAPANSLSEIGIQAGLLDGSTLPYTKEGLVSNFRNIPDWWDRLKADVFSLTNYRAKQNPGLQKFYELIMAANRMSMRFKNEANEAMRQYLNPSLNLGFTRLGDGATKTQKQIIDTMLYAGQRFAVSKFDLRPDTKRAPLVSIVNGVPEVNKDRLEELRKQGRRTVEEFRNGFTYTEYVDTPMTPAQQQKLRSERDMALAKATTDAERKAITEEFDEQLKAPTFMQPVERKFPGIPGLTEDSIEWKNYVIAREEVEKVEVELVKAHYIAHLKTIDGQLYEINEAMSERMTPQDREFLLQMNEKYRELYTANLKITPDGQVVIDPASLQRADEFVRAVNAAVIATRGSDRNAAVLAAFDASKHDDINSAIEDFKTRFAPDTEQARYVVQNKVKEIALDEIARNDGGYFAERTIATGYTPVLREGRFQVRMVAVDPTTDRVLKMKDTFQQQLSYHQVANIGEANVLRDRINGLFDGTTHEVAVWDSASRAYKIQPVKLEARAEQAVEAVAAPPQLNLNEFLIGLRRFSINLDPRKMEEVIVTLTQQNSRARNRLQRAFVPGADPDAAKAISAHIESRASTIAKTVMRPDIDMLMNLDLEQSRRLWGAGDTDKLQRLKERFEATQADPNATDQQKLQARRAYDEYVYQRQNTLRADKDGVNMTQRYYSEAARALNFMESQKNLDESDLGSGDTASRVRAFTSLIQLGASPATAALNLISLGTNTLPYLATYNSGNGFGGGFGFGPVQAAMFKALRQVGAPGTLDSEKNTAAYYRKLTNDTQALRKAGLTSDEALFLAREIEEGVAIPALSNSLIASARGRLTGAAYQKFVDGWMALFNRTESAARRAALLAAYRLQYDRGMQSGLDPEAARIEARRFAVRAAEDTLGEYSVMNRPAVWRGGVQQFLYMYKVFPTMSVQLLRNLPRKGQLVMLGGILALSGVSGLPFAQDLEDLVDTMSAKLGLKTPSIRMEIAKAIDEVLPGLSPYAINGLINAYAPGDIGARTSLGDIFPGTAILLPGADVGRELLSVAGPVAGMAQGMLASTGNLAGWAAYTAGLSDRPASLENFARNVPVTMVRAWADALAYQQSGAIVDKRGYVVSDEMSAMTVAARALGLYPTAASERYGMIRVSQRAGNMQRDIAATFYNAYVQARLRGDMAQANQVVREVREWNQEARGSGLEINNFQTNAIRRFREAQRTATARTVRTAPKNLQAEYERSVELLGY